MISPVFPYVSLLLEQARQLPAYVYIMELLSLPFFLSSPTTLLLGLLSYVPHWVILALLVFALGVVGIGLQLLVRAFVYRFLSLCSWLSSSRRPTQPRLTSRRTPTNRSLTYDSVPHPYEIVYFPRCSHYRRSLRRVSLPTDSTIPTTRIPLPESPRQTLLADYHSPISTSPTITDAEGATFVRLDTPPKHRLPVPKASAPHRSSRPRKPKADSYSD